MRRIADIATSHSYGRSLRGAGNRSPSARYTRRLRYQLSGGALACLYIWSAFNSSTSVFQVHTAGGPVRRRRTNAGQARPLHATHR